MARGRECDECGRIFYEPGRVCSRCSGTASPWAGKGGPFYQGERGRCPVCGASSEVSARGQGGWEEDRECRNGHAFHVTFNHSNDPGTVTEVYE